MCPIAVGTDICSYLLLAPSMMHDDRQRVDASKITLTKTCEPLDTELIIRKRGDRDALCDATSRTTVHPVKQNTHVRLTHWD
jgi:hypothetical protein